MKKLTRLKCLSCLILALAAALSLTACSADTASGVFPELSQIVGEIIQTAEESSPVTREFFQTQEPEEQSAEPERPDVPQTPGEGQVGTADMATWLLWTEVDTGLEDYQWTVANPALESQLSQY